MISKIVTIFRARSCASITRRVPRKSWSYWTYL